MKPVQPGSSVAEYSILPITSCTVSKIELDSGIHREAPALFLGRSTAGSETVRLQIKGPQNVNAYR
jgi:hypothetical protein